MIRTPHLLTALLLWQSITVLGQTEKTKADTCSIVSGQAEFSCAEYRDEEDTSELPPDTFTLVSQHFRNCFCQTSDKAFLKQLPTDPAWYRIEPLFINLSSCDGLYSFRRYAKNTTLTARFFNGFPHFVFLVSGQRIYFLNKMYDRDSLSVDRLLEREAPHLLTLFRQADIEAINVIGNRTIFWTHNVSEDPITIYDGRNIYYDRLKRK